MSEKDLSHLFRPADVMPVTPLMYRELKHGNTLPSKCAIPSSVTYFANEMSKNTRVVSSFAMLLMTSLLMPLLQPES